MGEEMNISFNQSKEIEISTLEEYDRKGIEEINDELKNRITYIEGSHPAFLSFREKENLCFFKCNISENAPLTYSFFGVACHIKNYLLTKIIDKFNDNFEKIIIPTEYEDRTDTLSKLNIVDSIVILPISVPSGYFSKCGNLVLYSYKTDQDENKILRLKNKHEYFISLYLFSDHQISKTDYETQIILKYYIWSSISTFSELKEKFQWKEEY